MFSFEWKYPHDLLHKVNLKYLYLMDVNVHCIVFYDPHMGAFFID